MLLDAKSFAVIGASRKKGKVGNVVFRNLLNSKLKVYPVNPFARKILGHKCYPSVKDIEGKVSHAVIAVPAHIVPSVIKDCGEAGVKVAIIISAGFGEAGKKELEEEVVKIGRDYGVRILGPNVLGVIVPGVYNASFFEDKLNEGGVAFISQSGALGVGVLDLLIKNGKGLRSFISVGNCADLTITDVLKEAVNDRKTRSIIIYAESLKKGREFMSVCRKSRKPIFILKAGNTRAGSRASRTHTGSLTGDKEVYSAAFRQCGARQVGSLKELINAALAYEKTGFLGKKALIITNAGGPGILMTDAVSRDFVLPKIPSHIVKKISKKLGKVPWSKANPMDLVGDATAERYELVLDIIKKEKFYDFIIALLTPQAMTEPLKTARAFVNFYKKTKKPVLACFIGGEKVRDAVNLMEKDLAVFGSIAELALAAKHLKGKAGINNKKLIP